MRTVQLALVTAAVALGAGFMAAPAFGQRAHAARSYLIVTDNGFVTRLGPWRLRDTSLARAIAVFGRPTSIKGSGAGCSVRWRYRHVTAIFANLGGYTACDPGYGNLQRFTVRSRAWRTIGGLRVGWSTSHMLRKYPDAELKYGMWGLVFGSFGYGSDDGYVATVNAVPRGGRVAALSMYVGGAGE